MIDIENLVFTAIYDALSGVDVTGIYEPTPSSFPSVSVVEKSNLTYTYSETVGPENHAVVVYEINIYSNLENGRKAQAKEIRDTVDDLMQGFGFRRVMSQPIDNADPSIYRIVSRYEGVVDSSGMVYRR